MGGIGKVFLQIRPACRQIQQAFLRHCLQNQAEVVQLLVPEREASLSDVAFNALGSLSGGVLGWTAVLVKRWCRRSGGRRRGGVEMERLRAEAAGRGLKNVELRPYQPRERLAESLGVADVHLVVLRPEVQGKR